MRGVFVPSSLALQAEAIPYLEFESFHLEHFVIGHLCRVLHNVDVLSRLQLCTGRILITSLAPPLQTAEAKSVPYTVPAARDKLGILHPVFAC